MVAPDQLATDDERVDLERIRHSLDAVALPMGYCFAPTKQMTCERQETLCYTCPNFCTTPDHLPWFRRQVSDAEELIELGIRAKHDHWVRKNQRTLERLTPIVEMLEAGKVHHLMGKDVREYPPENPSASAGEQAKAGEGHRAA